MNRKIFNLHPEIFVRVLVLVILGLAIFLFVMLLAPRKYTFENTNKVVTPPPTPVCQYTSPLNGECSDSDLSKKQTIAIMIDNSSDARPVSGINQARIVFEAIAEATITRYLALFDNSQNVEKIGPVRSARPYFVDWAGDFGSLYVHVGGSPDALKKLSNSYTIFDLNEFSNGNYFWRETKRAAPHNVFTSTTRLNDYLSKNNLLSAEFQTPWTFDQTNSDTFEKTVSEIALPCLPISWKYNATTKEYSRFDNAVAAVEGNGDKIVAKDLIFLYTESKVIDDLGRLNTKTTGSDKAIIFRSGGAIEAFWTRENSGGIVWQTSAGEKVRLTPGKIWITVLPRSCAPLNEQK